MANERLRSTIAAAQLTTADVAAKVGVDPKTVERWIATGRVPHRTHRWATASLLGTDETYLWPEAVDERQARSASEAELLSLYPHRGAVPPQLWRGLIEAAIDRIDILVFSGLFLPDGYPEMAKALASKAEHGTKVRLAFGDGLAARVRLSLTYLEEAFGPRVSSSASTRPPSTTPSTGSTTTCWSTPTCTERQRRNRRSCTSAACPVGGCSTTIRGRSRECGSLAARQALACSSRT